jgi:hypothetical protein
MKPQSLAVRETLWQLGLSVMSQPGNSTSFARLPCHRAPQTERRSDDGVFRIIEKSDQDFHK